MDGQHTGSLTIHWGPTLYQGSAHWNRTLHTAHCTLHTGRAPGEGLGPTLRREEAASRRLRVKGAVRPVRVLGPRLRPGPGTTVGQGRWRLLYWLNPLKRRDFARLKSLQNSAAFQELFWVLMKKNGKVLCYFLTIWELFDSFFWFVYQICRNYVPFLGAFSTYWELFGQF